MENENIVYRIRNKLTGEYYSSNTNTFWRTLSGVKSTFGAIQHYRKHTYEIVKFILHEVTE